MLRRGDAVTLESAAREAALTKPGLMYHFRTKEALMLGLIDHVAQRWEALLASHLRVPLDQASAVERVRAYVDFALTGGFDETDIVMLSDPRLRDPLATRWTEQMKPWIELPAALPDPQRARLTAARLMADGAWLACATGMFPPDQRDRERIRAIAYDLLED